MSWAEEQSWFGLEDLIAEELKDETDNLSKDIWTTKDGKRLLISKMQTSHIENCLRKIQKDYPWRKIYLESLTQELKRRQNGKKT